MADGGSSVPRSLCPEACALHPVLFLPSGLPVPSLSRRLSGCRGGQCPGLVPEIRYPFFFLDRLFITSCCVRALRATSMLPARAEPGAKRKNIAIAKCLQKGGVGYHFPPLPSHNTTSFPPHTHNVRRRQHGEARLDPAQLGSLPCKCLPGLFVVHQKLMLSF